MPLITCSSIYALFLPHTLPAPEIFAPSLRRSRQTSSDNSPKFARMSSEDMPAFSFALGVSSQQRQISNKMMNKAGSNAISPGKKQGLSKNTEGMRVCSNKIIRELLQVIQREDDRLKSPTHCPQG